MTAAPDGSIWLLAGILLAFPVVFAGIWSLVCAILATASGYRSLGAFRIAPARLEQGEPLATPWFAMVGAVSYRGRVLSLREGPQGLQIRVHRLFPFHPPLCVPWDRVAEGDGGLFGRWSLGSVLLDGRVRLRLPAATLAAVIAARARHAG